MPRSGKKSRSVGDALRVGLPAAFVLAAAFWAAYQFVEPAPPGRLVLATGAADGAYHAFGVRYREVLAREGIDVEVRATQGSVENLELLAREPAAVDAALVQGGTVPDPVPEGLVSLGSLGLEPVWIFVAGEREEASSLRLAELRGERIAVGPEGSGSRALAMDLFEELGIAGEPTRLEPIAAREAIPRLGGDVDAVFLVAAPTSPTVGELLGLESATLAPIARAEAWAKRRPFLRAIDLPEGLLDLRRNVPARDVTMLATAVDMVVRSDLHPALCDLLVQAADEIHSGGSLLADAGTFPSPEPVSLPLSPEARRFYRSGPPLLQRTMPFWVATQVDRLKVMLLPLVALLIPLVRILPPVYQWRVRSRVYRWYQRLQEIDLELIDRPAAERRRRLLEEVSWIEREVAHVTVPLSYADQLYALRLHVDLVKSRAREEPLEASASPSDPG